MNHPVVLIFAFLAAFGLVIVAEKITRHEKWGTSGPPKSIKRISISGQIMLAIILMAMVNYRFEII